MSEVRGEVMSTVYGSGTAGGGGGGGGPKDISCISIQEPACRVTLSAGCKLKIFSGSSGSISGSKGSTYHIYPYLMHPLM